ncbi:MAG TPA: spherulation-specific family 4 protein [Terriglobales bacterium]|nr:spherulation-specific family 4 protein [Terriglobales bacterium]
MIANWVRGLVVSMFLAVSLLAQVRLAAPSYQDPGSAQWVGWEAPGAQAVGIMIVNLNNGDDETYYASVDQAIRETRRKGIFVVGYTYTGYGTRDPQVVRRKIDAVYRNYLVDGIFFDEVPTDCNASNSYLPTQFLYYQQLTNYVREKGAARLTILNPGTYSPSDCWMGITNILVNWENKGMEIYRNGYVDYAWVHKYPPDRFWHIVYGMGANELAKALELAKERNAGWVYLTSEAGNPYASPPKYWAAEASAVEQQTIQAPYATAWPDSEDGNGARMRGRVSVRWSSKAGSQWQLFLDTDQNAKTGYHGGEIGVGAEYLLQGNAGGAKLWRYTGSGTDWSWIEIAAHAELDSLDANVLAGSFDIVGLEGANRLNYQIRALDVSGNPLGDSYVLPLSVTNTGLVFDILNHPY